MELLRKSVLENVSEPNEVRRFWKQEGSSHLSFLRPRGNQGWNSHKIEVGSHRSNLRLDGNQGWDSHQEEELRRYYQEWT